MSNIHNKTKNHICPCCGRDSKSHQIGSIITNEIIKNRKNDKLINSLSAMIILEDNPTTLNTAFLKINTVKNGRV